jgi:hypothetical protein
MKKLSVLLVGVLALAAVWPAGAADRRAQTFQRADMMNQEVWTDSGERIGRVFDVAGDTTGRPAYLMITEDRYPDRYTAVPMSVVKDIERNRVVLDINRNWIESAPHFAKFEWPSNANDPGKWDEVRGYYGRTTLLDPLGAAPDRPASAGRAGGVGPGGSDNPGMPGTGSAGGSTRGQMR